MTPASAILVTGGNSGIGFECAKRLAGQGLRVLIASRNVDASDVAVRRIAEETGNQAVEALELDLGSTAAIRRFAEEIEARNVPVRALVCNAGLQMNRGPVLSADGYELTFAVNHLGHFLLTNLLLRNLLANAPARIVVVASGVHDPKLRTGMPKARITDLRSLASHGGPSDAPYSGRLAYVNSKLCNLWFTYELMRRIEAAGLSTTERPLSVNAFEPGLVPGSGLARDYHPVARFLWNRVLPVLTHVLPTANSARRSGGALAGIVLDPALESASGRYFPSHSQFQQAASSEESYDEAKARALWEESERLTGLTAEESPLARPAAA